MEREFLVFLMTLALMSGVLFFTLTVGYTLEISFSCPRHLVKILKECTFQRFVYPYKKKSAPLGAVEKKCDCAVPGKFRPVSRIAFGIQSNRIYFSYCIQ